jgi:prevent-host-death family protein
MAEVGIKELKATASTVIDEVEGGAAYVVTKRGRPAAVLLPVEEAEDLVLANADATADGHGPPPSPALRRLGRAWSSRPRPAGSP